MEGDVTQRLTATIDDAIDTSRATFVTVSQFKGNCVLATASKQPFRAPLFTFPFASYGQFPVCAQGDACGLPAEMAGQYDAVLAANLLDRVPEPQRVLAQAREALAPGGVLVLTTPFSWCDIFVVHSTHCLQLYIIL